MKKIGFRFSVFVVAAALFSATLAGCGKAKASYATFKVGDETVKTVEIVGGALSEAEPEVPALTGYEGRWEEYSTENGDVTVRAVYEPVVYTATFIMDDEGRTETRTFTVEDESISAPPVPEKTAYSGEWEDYSVRAENFTVNLRYEPLSYTVTFMADGEACDERTYTIENRSFELPAVPSKEGLKGEWSEFDISEESLPVPEDITVTALYTSANATEGLYYSSVGDTEYGVCGITGNGGDVVVAGIYRNKPVTKVNPFGSQTFAFTGTIGTLVLSESVRQLCQNSFYNCTVQKLVILNPDIEINLYLTPAMSNLTIRQVFYYGTAEKWSLVGNKEKLKAEEVYYYSEEEPASQGKYWHFADDGTTPVIWSAEA